MNPSQLKTQLSLGGSSLTDQQNLEIWVLLDKLARIEYSHYLNEKNTTLEGSAASILDISPKYKQSA